MGCGEEGREAGREAGREEGREQTDRQTGRQAGRQAGRQREGERERAHHENEGGHDQLEGQGRLHRPDQSLPPGDT